MKPIYILIVHFFFYLKFWGAEKDSNRLESAIFEDLNRYCWSNQANNISGSSNQITNTDGQVC